jgi:hypothetical protein
MIQRDIDTVTSVTRIYCEAFYTIAIHQCPIGLFPARLLPLTEGVSILEQPFAELDLTTKNLQRLLLRRVEMLTWAFEMVVASVWRGLSVIAFRALRRRAE